MAKGTRYTPEFKAKAVSLLTESRGSYSSETKAVGRGRDGGVEESAGRGRAIEAGERDIDDGVDFFRGQARPGTALMAACIDEFKDRSRAGPVRGVPAASLDCGSITPRGCRMSRSGPVSRMAASVLRQVRACRLSVGKFTR